MPTRSLGRTGFQVSLLGLGGQAALQQPNNAAVVIPMIERAVDLGVNYFDTSPGYGGPGRWSERYIGEVMRCRRSGMFLASKIGLHRTRDDCLRLLEESLRFLQTDQLDLWQIRNLSRMEQLEIVFAPGGAVEALVAAREQKLVRFLGVTGHADPAVLVEAIRRYPFDTVLMALNAVDKHDRSFIDGLLPLAVEKEMGIIGMKVPARGSILNTYQPGLLKRLIRGRLPGPLSMREALYYVLSLPVSCVIIGCGSVAQMEENVQLARSFTPLTREQMQELEVRTRLLVRQALFYRNW